MAKSQKQNNLTQGTEQQNGEINVLCVWRDDDDINQEFKDN